MVRAANRHEPARATSPGIPRKPPKKVGLTAAKVAAALELADGSPVAAARLLGVTRNTVNYWRARIATAELSQPPENIPA